MAGSAKEATFYHPESFDSLRINSVKDLQILRRPAISSTRQNDSQENGLRMVSKVF